MATQPRGASKNNGGRRRGPRAAAEPDIPPELAEAIADAEADEEDLKVNIDDLLLRIGRLEVQKDTAIGVMRKTRRKLADSEATVEKLKKRLRRLGEDPDTEAEAEGETAESTEGASA